MTCKSRLGLKPGALARLQRAGAWSNLKPGPQDGSGQARGLARPEPRLLLSEKSFEKLRTGELRRVLQMVIQVF